MVIFIIISQLKLVQPALKTLETELDCSKYKTLKFLHDNKIIIILEPILKMIFIVHFFLFVVLLSDQAKPSLVTAYNITSPTSYTVAQTHAKKDSLKAPHQNVINQH